MPRTAYPNDADVWSLVLGSGITLPTDYDFTGYAASAKLEWERETGRTPFLADLVAVARTYDPPGDKPGPGVGTSLYGGKRALPLHAGIVQLTSISVGGAVLASTSYRLLPQNAPVMGKPYEIVEFLTPVFGAAGSVRILARWGWADEIPEDAFQAIIRIGASMIAQDVVREGRSGKAIEWHDGDGTSERKSIEMMGKAGETWAEKAARVIQRYRIQF